MRNLGLDWLDLVALVWFFAWCVGCSRCAEGRGKRVPSPLSAMAQYRRDFGGAHDGAGAAHDPLARTGERQTSTASPIPPS